ncbi:MAG: alpha/beta hydrolase [Planctomycetaceae bacterium]|nr:alpha/beta hydrolase [Planctomycetaceae bacterium]
MARSFWLTLLIGAVFAASSAQAATYLDLRLTPDGSANPPGDVLELDALFYPDDPPLRVEVRAFRVIETPPAAGQAVAQRSSEPIPASADATRDGQGTFHLEVTFTPPEQGHTGTLRIVVPYAGLKLPIGEHNIAYDITAFRGDSVEFASATEVSFMTLTAEPRTEISIPRDARTSSTSIENRTVKIADPSQPLGYREEQRQVTQENVTVNTRYETAQVTIPNGYHRRRRNAYMAYTAGGDADPMQAQLNSLQDGGKPWNWRRAEPILFATNRNIADPDAADLSRFGAEVSETVTYGSCFVTFPLEEEHTEGQIERPRWWERCDPDRHFNVDAVNILGAAEVQTMLRTTLRERDQDVLLMVHGFNNTFEFAVLRLAQVKMDIHFPGTAMLFSWPSQGTAPGYADDEAASAASVNSLKSVLKMLDAQRTAAGGDRRIHLLAHSMGNRVLLGALGQLAAEGFARDRKPFGQVILAAPDVDFVMMNRLQNGLGCAELVTLYYCEDDIPLETSRYVNTDSRIGQFGYVNSLLENVDAKYASTSLFGHDYFSTSNRLLVDLELLINLRVPAVGRTQTLKPRADSVGNQEWFFPLLAQ